MKVSAKWVYWFYLLKTQKEAKPCHSSDEQIRGKDFDKSKVCFFPKHFKKIYQGFPYGWQTLGHWTFALLFSEVKYKTSEIKRTYLYIQIFGGVNVSIWSGAIFNQTQLKNWPGVSLRVANPLSLKFCSSVFRVKNMKPNICGLVLQDLPKW